MYEFQDSPDVRALVQYLQQQIRKYEDLEYENEGTSTADSYYAKQMAYHDILNKIKIV